LATESDLIGLAGVGIASLAAVSIARMIGEVPKRSRRKKRKGRR
jgi:hypothetical protein